jgi:hypothetical protein
LFHEIIFKIFFFSFRTLRVACALGILVRLGREKRFLAFFGLRPIGLATGSHSESLTSDPWFFKGWAVFGLFPLLRHGA